MHFSSLVAFVAFTLITSTHVNGSPISAELMNERNIAESIVALGDETTVPPADWKRNTDSPPPSWKRNTDSPPPSWRRAYTPVGPPSWRRESPPTPPDWRRSTENDDGPPAWKREEDVPPPWRA